MKTLRIALAFAALSLVTGLAYVAQQLTTGANIVSAAQAFVDTLAADQKKQAVYDFESDERFNWHFIPLQDPKTRKSTRKGVPLEEMSDKQKSAALALLKAGTSDSGNEQVKTIMGLEAILLKQEGTKSAMVRNPDWYFFTIFGTPSKTGNWGWRIEGHHLSINVTMNGTQVVSSSPTFFGANPAEIKTGPNKGKRVLPQSEDYARDLFKSLDEDQKKAALQAKPFEEPQAKMKAPKLGQPVGIAGAKLTKEQKSTLNNLIKTYTHRMPAEVADKEMKQVNEAGLDKVHFAYTGETQPGKGFTYRVHGPTFVIEFLNVQSDAAGNKANHIHSCWRRIKGDFGVN